MAAPCINIYLDMNMAMFVDSRRSIPFVGPLFQKAGDHTTYYLNEACTLVAKLVEPGDSHISTEENENDDPMSRPSPSPSPSPMPENEGFSKDQTLFLIDLMRQHLDSEGDGLPKTLADLNARLKHCKANKKLFWKEAAEMLGSQFSQKFCPEKVARKWNTLQDAYKKVKDNNKSTGKGAMRFQFYREMDDLLGGQHDVVFPVVGTSEGLEVRRPEALGHCSSVTASAATASSQPATPNPTATATLLSWPPPQVPRKRRRVDEDLMSFLVQSEEASRRQHEETLAQMKSAQQGFEALMSRLLDKM